jgi:hypothetical protein
MSFLALANLRNSKGSACSKFSNAAFLNNDFGPEHNAKRKLQKEDFPVPNGPVNDHALSEFPSRAPMKRSRTLLAICVN